MLQVGPSSSTIPTSSDHQCPRSCVLTLMVCLRGAPCSLTRLSTRPRSSSARGISFRQPRHATRTRTRTLTTHAAAAAAVVDGVWPTHISHLCLRSSQRTAPDDASRVVAQRPHQAMDAHHDHPRYYKPPMELSLQLRPPADPLFSALRYSDDPDLVPDDVEIVKPGWVVPHEQGRGKEVLHWLVYVTHTHLPSTSHRAHMQDTAH
jgi:hypothetical protein